MNFPRALALFAVALAFVGLFATAGTWAPVVGPPLVQVSAIAPTDVEPGDRITIAGEGFPAGKAAQVRFRGTLHRPGERPVRDAEIVVTGVVTGPEQVEVDFLEATQALFCGAGDRAAHTTFEGDVEVAFAAAAPGAAPIAGVLRDAVLDVRPSASQADRARESEGERILAFLGLRVTPPVRRGVGLAVEAVTPGSPADVAGVSAGDVIASFDGVRTAAAGDLIPAAGEREATLGVKTQGANPETPRPIAVEGFRRAPPAELLGGALLIVAALAVLLLLGSPVPGLLATPLQRAAARLRASGGFSRAFSTAAAEVVPPASAPALVDALGGATLAVLPFGQYLVAARLDVELLFFIAATALAVAAMVAAGSVSGGLRAAVHVAWQHVPAAIAVASVVLTSGSLRVQEIGRAQGGWPWDWLAFRSPGALLALALLLGAALSPAPRSGRAPLESPAPRSGRAPLESPAPRSGRAPSLASLEALVDDGSAAARLPGGPWLAAACRAHRFVIAGLASALFLGGWSLPGLAPAQQDGRVLLEIAGVACLFAKTWALVLALGVLRNALPPRSLAEGSRATIRRGLPLAVLALAVTALWTRWSPEAAAQLLVSGSLVAVAGFAAVALVQRLRHGVVAPGADGHLSPFL
jgi:NADH-quinone oxidoreductase subunit H